MRTIELSRGFTAIVDDEDFDRLSRLGPWYSLKARNGRIYARRCVGTKFEYMHRIVMGVSDPKLDVDHEDHNGLNCQKHNLRICTRTQNNGNMRKTRGTSRYKGVSWDRGRGKWNAKLTITPANPTGKYPWVTKNLGRFSSEIEAAKAYDSAAREYFGQFALTNFRGWFNEL